jgi:hypothetical protein
MYSLADGHEPKACEDRFMVIPRQEAKQKRCDDEVRIMTRKKPKHICFRNKYLGIMNYSGLTTLQHERK